MWFLSAYGRIVLCWMPCRLWRYYVCMPNNAAGYGSFVPLRARAPVCPCRLCVGHGRVALAKPPAPPCLVPVSRQCHFHFGEDSSPDLSCHSLGKFTVCFFFPWFLYDFFVAFPDLSCHCWVFTVLFFSLWWLRFVSPSPDLSCNSLGMSRDPCFL